MTVTSYRGKPTQQGDLGELDPRDDDGFARILGSGPGKCPSGPAAKPASASP